MGTWITGMVLAAMAGLAIRAMRKDRRSGAAGQCGGDCSRCGGRCH